jgi:hypothetical protein
MTMTTSLEQDLMMLETAFWDAMRDRDIDRMETLTAERSVVVGASGTMAIDPRSMGRMMESTTWRMRSYRIDPSTVEVVRLSDDAAIIAYGVHEELTVDGKPVALDASDASVWQRERGTWRCALHTESLAGDAFGRDRH